MLFSQQDLADEMSELFECCGESMRPVPHATIDFGNGQVIERTLGGNVITWFCLADGRAFDVQPGLLDAPSYRAALQAAASAHRAEFERDRSSKQLSLRASRTDWAARHAETQSVGWDQYIGNQLAAQDGLPSRDPDLDPLRRLSTLSQPFPVRAEPPALQRALLKRTVELPLVMALGPELAPNPVQGLQVESNLSRSTLRPQALGLLAHAPLSMPAELSPHVYRLVFATDLVDPYLSMAPQVLGRGDAFSSAGSGRD